MAERKTGRASSIPGGIAFAAGITILYTLAGAAVTAWAVIRGTIPEQAIGYGVLIILITGSFLCAQTAWIKIKHRRAMVGLLSGLVYLLALLAINAMFFGGQYEGVGVTALAILAGSGCSILLGLRKPAGHRAKGHTIRRR